MHRVGGQSFDLKNSCVKKISRDKKTLPQTILYKNIQQWTSLKLQYALSSLMHLGVHRKVRIKSRVQWAVAGQQSKFLWLLYVT